MFGWLFGRKLEDVINETKKIRVSGVVFTIRKINILDYLDGSKVLIQAYDTHKTAAAKAAVGVSAVSDEKVRRHYADVLVSGVVYPKLVHEKISPEEKSIVVEDLFRNWGMVEKLYEEIMLFTHGKKKLKRLISAEKNLSKSIS